MYTFYIIYFIKNSCLKLVKNVYNLNNFFDNI